MHNGFRLFHWESSAVCIVEDVPGVDVDVSELRGGGSNVSGILILMVGKVRKPRFIRL